MCGCNRNFWFGVHHKFLESLESFRDKGSGGKQDKIKHQHCSDYSIVRAMLRVGEAVNLQWKDVNFTTKHLYVKRLEKGSASIQPYI